MKDIIASVFFILMTTACQYDSEPPPSNEAIQVAESFAPSPPLQYSFGNWTNYNNKKYSFSLEYPETWWVAENKGETGPPVINVYSAAYDDKFQLPLTIQEDPLVSHVSFFPEGLGTSRPMGPAVGIGEIDVPITFNPDSSESVAYQLNDGEVWGYYLKPQVLPPGWKVDGFVFVQVKVQDVQIKCFDDTGKEKDISSCNPLNGGDRVIKYGTVDETDRKIIDHILSTLYFTDTEDNRRPITEVIRIEALSPNDTIESPAVIRGRARGPWFFEGRFPVVLRDKNHAVIGRSSAIAMDNWMTPALVPFELKIDFNPSQSGQAYLLFEQSNASGNPENDRGYIFPIILN